jgi:hypothetical protein
MPRAPRLKAKLCITCVGVTFAAFSCTIPSSQPELARNAGAEAAPPRSDCYACHDSDYRHARRHVDVKPTRCAVCHRESSWHPIERNHPWPLTGAHEKADCFACHTGTPARFEHTDNACVACHRADFDRSEYPGHDKFALTCEDCHTTEAWKPAKKPSKKHQAEPAADAAVPVEAAPEPQPTAAAVTQPAAVAEPAVAPDASTQQPKPSPAMAPNEPAGTTPAPKPAAQRKPKRKPTTKVTTPARSSKKTSTPAAQATQASKAASPTPSQPVQASNTGVSKPGAAQPTTTAPAAKRKHPESAFPIASGHHADIECKECHSQPGAMGKGNTDCVQCHKRSKYDRKHARITDYPLGSAPVSFCVNCHTRGTVKPVARSR